MVARPGSSFEAAAAADPTPEPYPDAHKEIPYKPIDMRVPGGPDALVHPCGAFNPEPPFMGVSPLSFTVARPNGNPLCNGAYGDPSVWQHDGHTYVASAYFSSVGAFHIWNVDDPYNPQYLTTQYITGGGSTLTSFAFKQGNTRYLSVSTRGSNCGWHVYDVTNPASPVFVTREVGTDWCIVHEHFVSTDANGDADYAWLAMSGESGSGDKMVVLDLANIQDPVQTGKYERPDRASFIHDITVIGNRVFSSHWLGGLIIHDKMTLAHNIDPLPLNPVDSIRPAGFQVHHSWTTTDGNFVFIEDEFLNGSNQEKVKYYNITDINNPVYVGGIIGNGIASTAQAHNLKVLNLAPGIDQLFVAWYRAGSRGYLVNTQTPGQITVTENIRHEYRTSAGSGFGGAWGMDYFPCTLRGQQYTCVVTADYERHGIIIDALGEHDRLDPYEPDVPVVTNTAVSGCEVTITGTARDYYSGIAAVEGSVNGGPWLPATGTDNWTFTFTASGNGQQSVVIRARDNGDPANTRSTSPINVDVTTCGSGGTATVPVPTVTSILPSATIVPATMTRMPSSTVVVPTVTLPAASATSVPATGTSVAATATAGGATSTAPAATSTVMMPTATACTITFTDVPPTNTFYAAIRCLACRGVISGYADGTFRPNAPATRGQIAKIVSNAAGFNDPATGQRYEDVQSTNTFYEWIERLSSRSIIGGYPCGQRPTEPCNPPENRPYFRPFENATRGQVSKIVSNAAGFTEPMTGQFYADVEESNPFYVEIMRLTTRGAMSGYQCGGPGEPCDPQNRPYFRWGSNITRGQLAQIIQRIFYPNCQTP
jgi:hypothetical protein